MADGSVPVVLSPVPFSRDVQTAEAREGATVRAVLTDAVARGALALEDLPRVSVYIDGARLERDATLGHVLARDEIVNVVVEPLGGGGGGRKDVGQILLTIAVVAVSAWVGGGSFLPSILSSAFRQQVAAAAILTLGQAAVAAVFKPETAAQAKVNERYALQSASNQYRPWQAFPLALGSVVVAPDMAVKTFTQAIGDDVWIYGILGLHYGPCEVAELKIGDTLVSSMGEGDFRMAQHLTPGPRDFSIYANDVDQLDVQEELQATTGSATPVVRAGSGQGERFEFDFYLPGGLNYAKDDGRLVAASVTVTIRYRAIDDGGAPIGGGGWIAGTTMPLTAATNEPWRLTRDLILPLGRYEFQIQRSVREDNLSKRHDDIAVTAIRSIAFRRPVADETLSIIEFAARATALNQGTLAPITCRITPLCETWTGTEWGPPAATSNPAALTRWLMTGPAPAKPLATFEADGQLREWSRLCDEYDWTAAFYLIEDRKQDAVLGLLEQAGRASLFHDGTQLVASPWVEKPIPRQLFTDENLKDHRWTIVYPDEVHALRVEFQNIDEGGDPDELYVYADGYAVVAGAGVEAAVLIEALRLEGQKTAERAFRDGRWELGRRLHQRRIDTWTTDIEHVVSRYGDRVRLAWQRANEGASARVRCRLWSGGQVIGLRLTQAVEMIAGEDYALDMRLTGGLQSGVSIDNPATTSPIVTRSVMFADPRDEALSPRAGDLVAFGVANRVSEDVEIIGIEPGADLTAVITGIRYVAPLLMAGETGPIPPLQSRLTRQRSMDPPAPTLLGIQVEDTGVRVGFAMPPWSGSPITGFDCRWRPKPAPGQTVGWSTLPSVGASAMTLTTPPMREAPKEISGNPEAEVTQVEIEIVALTASGRVSRPLQVTAVKPVAPRPSESEWSVAVRGPDEDGTQQPGLTVFRNSLSMRTPSVLIEYAEQNGAPWTPAYSGPADLPRYDITGLSANVAYWVAITNLSAQGIPSSRRVYGPFTVGSLVAGSVGGVTAADLQAFFREAAGTQADTDRAAEVLIDEALSRHAVVVEEARRRVEDITAEALARGTAIAEVTTSVVSVTTALGAEVTTRATQYAAIATSVALVESSITTVVTALSAETTTRNAQISAVNTSISGVISSVSTVASDLASLTSSTTTQFSSVNGALAGHTTSISTNASAIAAETSARTTAISTLNGSVAAAQTAITTVSTDLAAEVSARTALASSTSSGLATINSTLTTLSSNDTVQSGLITTAQTTANGASSSATFALSALNGNQAYITLLTDLSGRLTGQRINGVTSAIDFLGEYFNVTSTSGSGIAYSAASKIFKIYDGTAKTVLKAGGDIRFWSGPSSVADGSETEANGVIALGPGLTAGGRFNGRTLTVPFDSGSTGSTPISLGSSLSNIFYVPALTVAGGSFQFTQLEFESSGTGTPDGEGVVYYEVAWQVISVKEDFSQQETLATGVVAGAPGPGGSIVFQQQTIFDFNFYAAAQGGQRRLYLQMRFNPGSPTTAASVRNIRLRGWAVA